MINVIKVSGKAVWDVLENGKKIGQIEIVDNNFQYFANGNSYSTGNFETLTQIIQHLGG